MAIGFSEPRTQRVFERRKRSAQSLTPLEDSLRARLSWLAFGSVHLLLLVLLDLPFALLGDVAAVYAMGGILNVGTMVGFVMLFGITMRNGIMMVSHWQHLHEVEGVAWGPELVFRGARERLAPVLMTALVTGLGLLAIAIGSGAAGREIEGPMALVILGAWSHPPP